MRIEIVPVAGGAQLRRFIRVPFAVHRGDRSWIPPLLMERKEAFSAKSNEFLRRAETRFWIARSDGREVGRISAQIDPLARRDGAAPAGHFGCLSAVNDREVFASLLGTAEEFLRSRGLERALGPFSLSINEETGLLVDGFDTPPMMMMGHDPPYAASHLEALGYRKEKDVYAYLIDRDAAPLSSAVRALFERRLAGAVDLRRLDFRDYANEIRRMVDIFNDAWSENWGFVPLTNAEADELAKRMRMLLDDRLVWFAEIDGEAVGFIVMLPNINEAIADLDGRLLPIGWAKLLWRLKMRRIRSARVPLMGVRKRLAGTVLGSTLPIALISALEPGADAFGFRKVELSWILEDNRPMRHILERLGAVAYKTYRVYGKALG
ncbi:MAG: GNAT family N-acetyltransferase [Steroidobacteraceae bacterium]